jgi:drug/metabolite transporter (DMT)-like permease
MITKLLLLKKVKSISIKTKNTRTIPSISSKIITSVAFCLLVLLWGLAPVAIKLGVQDAPPLFLSSMRYGIATCTMLMVNKLILGQKLRLTWKQYRAVFIVGILIAGVTAGAFAVAVRFAPAGALSVMWATTPIFTSLFTAREEGEMHGWRLIVSLIIGMMGVILVLTGGLPFLIGASQSRTFTWSFALMGELAVLGSAALYGFALRLAKQSTVGIPVATLVTWQVFFGSSFLGLMSILFEHGQTFHFTWKAIGSLLYTGIICGLGCNVITFWLIRRIGAIRTAYSDFIIPGITLFLSFVLLGESLTLAKFGGLALVLLGAAFAFSLN